MKIQKMNKEKFKNWTIFLFFWVVSVLNSCSNFLSFDENRTDENKTAAQDDKCIITVSSDFYSNDGSRAAFPDFLLSPDTLYFAEISYTSGSSKKWLGEDSVSDTAVVLKNNYSDVIRFVFCAPQETSAYTLALYACPKQTGSQVSAVKKSAFAQGDAAFELSAGQKVVSSTLNIKLKPQESSGKGNVNLPLSFDPALGIVAAKVNVTKDGVSDSGENNYGFKIEVSENSARLSAENVPAGTYLAIMKFYNRPADFSSSAEVAVNSAVQHISVYSEMTTNLWFIGGKKHGTTEADGTFKPSALELTKYDFTELYVCGTDGDGESDGKRSFYVSSNFGFSVPDGNDTYDGSMAKPFATVQKAVDTIAASGDTSKKYTIYVDGTVEPPNADTELSNETFISIKGTTPSNLDLTIKGLSAVSKAVLNAKQKNRRHGRVLTSENTSLTLENLKITGGKVNDLGGGIYIISGSLTLKNCVVTKNESSNGGGGINFYGEKLIVEKSEISGNKGDPGGICVAEDSAETEIKDTRIIDNVARSDGGLDLAGESTIEGCEISGNKAKSSTDGVGGSGGGLTLSFNNKSCKIINSVISKNTANKDGGGIYMIAGSLILESGAAISDNTAGENGGGIYINGGEAGLSSCTIKANMAGGNGGAIYASCEHSTTTVNIAKKNDSDDIIIEENNAKRGGAFYGADNARFVMNAGQVSGNYSTGNTPEHGGGAMFLWGGTSNYSTFTMNGGEIIGNMAKSGGAGGAVHIDDGSGKNAAFIMTGGLLSGNKATDENGNVSKLGGAIYVKNGGQIKLGGSAVIAVENDGNDIWLAEKSFDNKEISVKITGELTPGNNNDAKNPKYTARITPENYKVGRTLITADSGVTLKDEVGKFCVTGNAVSDEWFITTEGKLSMPAAISSLPSSPDFSIYPKLTVSSGDEMNKLSGFVNNGNTMAGTTVTLLNDITLGSDFQKIGNTDTPFSGTFDGNGKTINSGTASLWTIFYQVTGGTIKNLTSSGKFSMSGIVANLSNNGLIENCTNTATVTSDTYSPLGGVCAKMEDSVIDGCVNKGSVNIKKSGTYISLGGICGSATGVIKNSTNYASVVYTEEKSNDSCFVGGILGTTKIGAGVDTELYNCINIGDVSGNEETTSGIGGILGDAYVLSCSVFMQNCVNMGNSSKNAIAGKCAGTSKDKAHIDFTYYLEGSATSDFAWDNPKPKAYSFKKRAALYMTTERVTVGTFPSDDLIYLLNEWVTANSSDTKKYLKWEIVDDRPSLSYK